MAFTPLFTVTQILGAPSKIIFTDTSVGSDAAIGGRRIYLKKVDGTYLVPSGSATNYIDWALASTSLTVDVLNKDYALLIIVEWVDVATFDTTFDDSFGGGGEGSGSELYSYTILTGLSRYNEDFDYTTTKILSANPSLFNDNNFWENKSLLRTFIDAGNNAVLNINDQYSCQVCYDAATQLRTSSQYSFNQNT